jgi:hypothetical protein
MTKIVHIDSAAFAFTRWRFIRALIASGFANIVFVAIAFVPVFALDSLKSSAQLYAWPPGVVVMMTICFVAFYIIIGTVGLSLALTLLRVLPRRVVAAASLYPILIFSSATLARYAVVLRGTGRGFGYDLAFLATFVIVAVLFVEMTLYALWTACASQAAYLSVRGWRPPWRRLISNFEEQIGFPTFAAFLSRGRVRLGLLFLAIAALNSYFFGVLTLAMWAPASGESWTPANIAVIAPAGASAVLVLLGLGRVTFGAMRRRATCLYQGVREWDSRPPILFLRTFRQDKTTIDVRTRDLMLTWPAGLRRARQMDEILLETAAPFGPLIAIGDPLDPVPPLGAARIFVKDEQAQWQDVVSALLDASRFVVICPTITSGVAWEIAQVQEAQRLARTIILANPAAPRDETVTLFEEILRNACGDSFEGRLGRISQPIVAFLDPTEGWTILAARVLSVQTYTVAMNRALQSLLATPQGLRA